jgi:hypothetical protein
LTGLQHSTTYQITVRARNGDGIPTAETVAVSTVTLPARGGSAAIDAGLGAQIQFDIPQGSLTIDVPPSTFPESTVLTVDIPVSFPSAPGLTLDLEPTGNGFRMVAASGQQPRQPMALSVPYANLESRGIDEKKLVLARYDEAGHRWIPLPSQPDPAGDRLTATIGHLSLFQVMQARPAASVNGAVAFPNPFRPAAGHTEMVFSRLPPSSRVRIYTLTGELVRDLSADDIGVARWDGRNSSGQEVASGVYFVLLQGNGGRDTIKVAVQR